MTTSITDLAQHILAAEMRATIQTPDGPLAKVDAAWSKETGDRATAVVDPYADFTAWLATVGPHDEATLSEDSRHVRHVWCRCAPEPDAATWVRYERWTARGRVAHGYVCPRLTCRGITQTG